MEEFEFEGWVMKKSWINNWNRRYFILDGTILLDGKTKNITSCQVLYDLSLKGCRVEMNRLLSRDIISFYNGNLKIFSCYADTERGNTKLYEIFCKVLSRYYQSILYEGYLLKRGSFVKNWKHRYTVLTNDKMVYYSYNTKNDTYVKKGEIILDATTTIHLLPDTKSHQNRFSVTTRLTPHSSTSSTSRRQQSRILYISVSNLEQREEWVTALREAVAFHLSNSQQHRLSAFALLSDHGQPGWMNAMFEDDFIASSPPLGAEPYPPMSPIKTITNSISPHDENYLQDRISSE